MTLVISAVGSKHAVLAADCRLTRVATGGGGAEPDDDANKVGELVLDDARLAFAFSGLASTNEGFDAHEWALSALGDAARPDFSAMRTLERFGGLATRRFGAMRFRKDRVLHKRFSVVFAGFVYEDNGPRPYKFLVSNWEHWGRGELASPRDEFMVSSVRELRPTSDEPFFAVALTGAYGIVPEGAEKVLAAFVADGKPAQAVENKAVELIRAAAASVDEIGNRCLTAVVPRDLAQPMESQYHTPVPSQRLFFPSHVIATSATGIVVLAEPKVEATAGVPIALPRVGRNAPCPCGSGRKFKRCHGPTGVRLW